MSQFETLKKHPFALLVLALVAVDLSLMSSAVGNARTLATLIDQSWCWVRPFAWAGNRIDLFLLSLACSQLGLTTI
jgi:hypothetical protein